MDPNAKPRFWVVVEAGPMRMGYAVYSDYTRTPVRVAWFLHGQFAQALCDVLNGRTMGDLFPRVPAVRTYRLGALRVRVEGGS